MSKTIILTRKPNDLYQDRNMQGRYGTLIVLSGAKVQSARIMAGPSSGNGSITVPTGVLDVTTSNGGVQEIARYTTIERMGGYVQLHPQPEKAYPLTFEQGNQAVAKLPGSGGLCYRVHGGRTPQERAILIHEAPNVGWLIGCIGPRKLGDRKINTDSCHHAMKELIDHIGRHDSADLFVLDW